MAEINKIKIKNLSWVKKQEPYKLEDKVKTMGTYAIWVDNGKKKEPKKTNTSKLKNYGYLQINIAEKEKFIQYLDSEPELEFANKIFDVLSSKDIEDKVKFFAKMPTLGSQIYFEYFSKKLGIITKSYMDFALKYEDKVFMFEVKSKDKEYDPKKTAELLAAYKIYMEKFSGENINLILCQYDSEIKKLEFHAMVDGAWNDELNIIDIMNIFLK